METTVLKATTPRELLVEWHTGCKLRLLSHYDCAKRYDNYGARLGLPVVIISAIASVVSTIPESDFPWVKAATTCITLLVTILTGVTTFLKWPDVAAKHRAVANQFSVMRRDLEVLLVTTDTITAPMLDDFKKKWNELDANSPGIPDAVYKQHECRACPVPKKTGAAV